MRKKDITKEVMEQVHEGRVKMRPRLYFVVGSLLLGGGFVGAIMLSIFFFNLSFFGLRTHGPLGYLWFGEFGIRPFLATFPWLPLLLAVGGVVGGIMILRHYEVSYKKSFWGLAIGLVSLILVSGLLLDVLGFNERIGHFEQPPPQGQFRPPQTLYRRPFYQEQFAGRNWVVGKITEVEDQRITITTPAREKVVVTWDKTTYLPFGSDFTVGEIIRAVGQWQDDNTFAAKGIGRGGAYLPTINSNKVRGTWDQRMLQH